MPLYTDNEAQDALNGALETMMGAASPGVIGSALEIRWPRMTYAALPDALQPWGRVSYQTVTQGQASLGHCDVIGKRRFQTIINLMFEVYTPMAEPLGVVWAEDLSRAARNGFRALRLDGIILIDPRVVELPSDGKSYRRLFVVECRYDTAG